MLRKIGERADMTENEAIKILKKDSCYECAQGTNSPFNCEYGGCRVAEATREAIKALEEIQQYRTIGTPEECREAMEKQAEKKVLHNEKAKRYFCPTCERKCNYMHSLYCSGCGQKLDWSDEE